MNLPEYRDPRNQSAVPVAPARSSAKREAARALARKGFRVFPLIPNDKRPLIKGWQAAATTDRAQIDAWWKDTPDANIGIPTDGLLVVDLDPRNGSGETIKALTAEKLTFPDSLASVTAGGGAHMIFALPEGVSVRGGTNLLGPGIDIKSSGGYIVAAGSTIDGKPYQWLRSPANTPIAIAPQWLRDRCERRAERNALAGQRVAEEDADSIARAEWWLSKHAPEAVEGERDNTAFKVAAKLYDFGLEPVTCREYLLQWNEGWCHPPLDSDSIERIVASAATNRQTAIGSKSPNASGFTPVEIAPRESDTAKNAILKPDKRRRLSFTAAAEAALTEAAEPLIDGLLDRHAMSVWYGAPSCGKTFVMLDAAWHIAAGQNWAGMSVKQGAVVYVAAEAGTGVLKRMRALQARNPIDVPLHIIPCPIDLLRNPADQNWLVQEVKATAAEIGAPVELIVIDTLSRAIAGGNENESAVMGAFVMSIDALRQATNAHVAVIHHTGKDKSNGARGHTSLQGATDTEIEIRNQTIHLRKQRDGTDKLSLPFRLMPVQLGFSPNGKALTSCVVKLHSPDEPIPLTPRLEGLFDLIEASIEPGGTFGWQLAAECLKESDPRAYCNGISRQVATKALQELQESGWLKKIDRNQWVIAHAKMQKIATSNQRQMQTNDRRLRAGHFASRPIKPRRNQQRQVAV